MSLLSLERVSHSFHDGRSQIVVLREVSLAVDTKEFVGIWGGRRSGKTTLLRIAAGLELPDAGSVLFDGQDIAAMPPGARATILRHRGIGLFSGETRLQRNQEVVEHVALPLLSDRLSMREARKRAMRALERVDLASCAFWLSGRLSQTERVRVGLAQALVHEPRVLLVDEPSVLLRPAEAASLFDLLRSLGREDGRAVVVASEDVAALRGANRVLALGGGRLREAERRAGELIAFPERRGRR